MISDNAGEQPICVTLVCCVSSIRDAHQKAWRGAGSSQQQPSLYTINSVGTRFPR
jgi:hypothetical protein